MVERGVTEERTVHKTSLSLVKEAPAELDAGTDMTLKVQVACSAGCDLRGHLVRLVNQDGIAVNEIELTGFDGTANETGEFLAKAPTQPGEYAWTAAFIAQEKEGVLHEGSSTPFSLRVIPHAPSIAVWDIPFPVVTGSRFQVKVGVSCSAGCKLTGQEIEISNHQGARVGTGVLGEEPWPGTSALYWAEVQLSAPGAEGYYDWTVKLPQSHMDLPHNASAYTWAFGTARPPEHIVTVQVVDEETQAPVPKAQLTLHATGVPYRSVTDDQGVGRFNVPQGEYTLYVMKRHYKDPQLAVAVAGDLTVKVDLVFAPPPQR